MKNPLKPLIIITLTGIVYISTLSAQNVDSLTTDPTDTVQPKFLGINPESLANFNDLADLHISYYGTTQNCKPFNIYSFKYKKSWFFIANQDNILTFFVVNPPRLENQKIVSGSDFLLSGLGRGYKHSYMKLKRRRRVVKDLEIYGFYKFTRTGKKSIKGLLLLEYPDLNQEPPWPFKWLAGKAAEQAEKIEGIIPEITIPELTPPRNPALFP